MTSDPHHHQPRRYVLVAMTLAALCSTGCHSFFNSWFDPSQVGRFSGELTLDIRTSLSLQDSPLGIPDASDPQPRDLIPVYEEYRYEVGDVLNIRIFELLARGTETAAQATIDEVGKIVLPVLGEIHVAGLARSELTEELVRLLDERGLIKDATVIVEPVVRRGLTFVVFGATPAPNLYPLPTPNTRLLEALNISGGFVDSVTDIYVIRNAEGAPNAAAPAPWSGRGMASAQSLNGVALASAFGSSGATRGNDDVEPANNNAAELINAVQKPGDAAPVLTQPATDIAPAGPTDRPRWIFVNGEWVESDSSASTQTDTAGVGQDTPTPTGRAQPAPDPTPPADQFIAPPPASPTQDQAIDWEMLAGDRESRVIRISAKALRDGDPRQNIVVRAGDTIRILAGQVGEYYMMGQIIRPGAYSLTGRQITLKSAVASAGNLAPLAWPDRCTIYRRYGDREEMHQVNLDAIFAGKEPDVLLKNNDVVLVGTHPVAPFLAVFRNAFRLTYGFGFVYDRNFADIDSYQPQINPSTLAISGSNSRFPNIFR